MTGRKTTINVLGRDIAFFNQRNRDWTHLYQYENNGSTLSNAGCGIFALCHLAQWLTGREENPEFWADFSCQNGGRGDDGTDRPALLHALQATGEAAKLGFHYEEDGLRNDLDTLYEFLRHERGVAMCNLRVGHIVALVAARELYGRKQLLAIDSVYESSDERVRDHVIEVVPGTEISCAVRNASGLIVGENTAYAAFWVDASLPRDFNLLHRL